MAGNYFGAIISLRSGAEKDTVSEKIGDTVLRHGFGFKMGVEWIRKLGGNDEGDMLDILEKEVEHPCVITIVDNPGASSAWEILQRQLHPKFANPEDAKILKCLADIWSIDEIRGALFIIMHTIGPDLDYLPRYEVPSRSFLEPWQSSRNDSITQMLAEVEARAFSKSQSEWIHDPNAPELSNFRFREAVLDRPGKWAYLNNRSQNLCFRFAIRDAFSTAESKSGSPTSAGEPGPLVVSTTFSAPWLADPSLPGSLIFLGPVDSAASALPPSIAGLM